MASDALAVVVRPRTGERHMRDAAWRRCGLDLVVLLEALHPLQRRTPRPSRIGTTTMCMWSTSPAERNSLIIVGPPPCVRPAVGGLAGGLERLGGRSVDEVDVVPPSISIDGRGWWVRMKVGVWNGGLGPHAPFQSGSSCHPGGPHLFAPMISAPIPGANRCEKALSTPLLPPGRPTIRATTVSRTSIGAAVRRRARTVPPESDPRRWRNRRTRWRSCECGE